MNKGIKLVLGGLAALVVLLLVAVVLVVLLVDLNRFKPQIQQAVKDQTGRDLLIQGDLSWSLYPVLGIELGQTQLSNAPGFGDKPMASVQSVSVGVALLPLLKGNLGVSELVLEKPQISLARKADGTTNWDDLIKASEKSDQGNPEQTTPENTTPPEGSAETPSAESQPAGKSIQIAIEGVKLADADLEWNDEQGKQQVRIASLTLTTGPIQPGEPTDIELSLKVANQNPQVDADISLKTTVASAEDFSWVEWQDLVLKLNAQGKAIPARKAELELKSAGRFYVNEQTLNVQQTTLDFNVPELNQNLNAKGQLSLALQGNLAAQTFSSQSVNLDATLDGQGLPGNKLDVQLKTPFSADLKKQTLSLPAVILSTLGINLNAKVDGKKIVEAPEFAGTLNIADFSPKAVMERLGMEAPKMSDAKAAEKMSLATQFSASPQAASLSKLKIVLDDSNLNGDAQVKLGDKTDIGFNLALDQINADRYLPPPSEDKAKDKPAPASDKAGKTAETGNTGGSQQDQDSFAWMDSINLDGKIKVTEAQAKGLKFSNIVVNVHAKDRILTLDPLAASLYGGRQTTKLTLDATAKEPKTTVATQVQTMNFGPFLVDLIGKSPLEGIGGLNLNLNLTGLTPEAIQKSLAGSGELSFTDGAFRGVNAVQALVDTVAKAQGKPEGGKQLQSKINDMMMKFNILQGGDLKWTDASGRMSAYGLSTEGGLNLFTQTLDTTLNITVPDKLKGSNDLLAKLAGQTIPVQIGGTLTDPKISQQALAESAAKALVGGKLQEVEQKVQEKLGDKTGDLQEKAGEKLQKGLNKLFGGSKKQE